MNMRPPGGPSTMPATSDLLGDNSNDSVASCQPLSSGQIQQCLNDDISRVSIVESQHSLQLLSVCSCNMQADLVIITAYHAQTVGSHSQPVQQVTEVFQS